MPNPLCGKTCCAERPDARSPGPGRLIDECKSAFRRVRYCRAPQHGAGNSVVQFRQNRAAIGKGRGACSVHSLKPGQFNRLYSLRIRRQPQVTLTCQRVQIHDSPFFRTRFSTIRLSGVRCIQGMSGKHRHTGRDASGKFNIEQRDPKKLYTSIRSGGS